MLEIVFTRLGALWLMVPNRMYRTKQKLLDVACMELAEWWTSSQEKEVERFTGESLMRYLSVFSPGLGSSRQ